MKPVAVHFNFKAEKLSVRAITSSGKLGPRLALSDHVVLKDCVFTVDETKRQKWLGGNKHARQFAEIRGTLTKDIPANLGTEKINFQPRIRGDFYMADNEQSIAQAAYAEINGKNIVVAGACL